MIVQLSMGERKPNNIQQNVECWVQALPGISGLVHEQMSSKT